ncbi:histidine--tRNA ligase [bacterium]|nr:MAG: histidine--tRNA ligase [bacterium]
MGVETTQPVRGFRDLTAPDAHRLTALEALARRTLARYGFSEVRLPTVEEAKLFVKSTGETSDIVEKEMFSVHCQGHDEFALRPEGTPGVVRAWLNKNLRQLGGVTKLYYMGSMFRAERPQKGRYREFEQFGVETLGNPHPAADVESILALKALFDALGLGDKVRLRLNNIGCDADPSCRPAYRTRLKEFLSSRLESLCESCRRRVDRNPMRVLDCKGDGPRLAAEAPRLEPCGPCREHVGAVSTLLAVNNLPHTHPDPTLVRGLDYYTRTVFEFSAEGLGSQDAVAGGGRYDALVAAMGGPDTPAVGWGLGVERLLMAAEAADPSLAALGPSPDSCSVYVAVQTPEGRAVAEGTRLVEALRRFDLRADGGLFASSLKAQLKEAGRRGARLCVIIGETELAKMPPACVLKDMAAGTQEEVRIEDLVQTASRKLLTPAPPRTNP